MATRPAEGGQKKGQDTRMRVVRISERPQLVMAEPNAPPQAVGQSKGGEASSAAHGRASPSPACKPKSKGQAGSYSLACVITAFFRAHEAADHEKKRSGFFGSGRPPPLPPPPKAPRPARGSGSDPPGRGWRPPQKLLGIMSWRKQCGGATPAPRGPPRRRAAAAPPRPA